jgi:hypothetical protein
MKRATHPYRQPAHLPLRPFVEAFGTRWRCSSCEMLVIGDTPEATLAGVIRHLERCSR